MRKYIFLFYFYFSIENTSLFSYFSKHENGILPFLVDVSHSMIQNFRPTYGPCYAVMLLIFVVVCLMAGKYFISSLVLKGSRQA